VTVSPRNIVANRASEVQMLVWEKPNENHNGGSLHAYSTGGHNARCILYQTTGDAGEENLPNGRNFSQDDYSPIGKVLRFDVTDPLNVAIPSDNPFANPWTCTLDTSPGGDPTQLVCAEPGFHTWEEVNVIKKGGNYGWDQMEGPDCFPAGNRCNASAYTAPALYYPHDNCTGVCGEALVGVLSYQGPIRALVGKWILSDFVGGLFVAEDNWSNLRYLLPGNLSGPFLRMRPDANGEPVLIGQCNPYVPSTLPCKLLKIAAL
jgi:glucose/arabinose dehydrogenase